MAQVININGVVMNQENIGSFRYRRKHERQNRAISSGTLTMMGNGATMGAILYSSNMFTLVYTYQILFFVGVIIGTLVTSISLKMLRKVIHYYSAAVLLIISGGLFTAFDNFNFDLIKAASFISGLSFGISLLTVIIHSGEISVKHLRGSLISNIQLCIDGGIFVSILISYIILSDSNATSFNPIKGIGIAKLIWGILSLLTAFFFVYESPIFLLEANNEQEATKNLIKLRKELNNMSGEIQNEIEIMRTTINNKTNSIINGEELIPFLKIFACRFAYALGTSVPVNIVLLTYYAFYVKYITLIFTLYLARFLAGIIPIYLIDGFLGRKLTLLISFIGSGIFLVVIQSLFRSGIATSDLEILKTAGLLVIIYYIFLGLGGSSVSYTYMSEVFNHSSKPYMNALIIILENAVHLIIIQFSFHNVDDAQGLIYFAAAAQIVVGALSYGLLPETKGKTLLEAQHNIKTFITLRS